MSKLPALSKGEPRERRERLPYVRSGLACPPLHLPFHATATTTATGPASACVLLQVWLDASRYGWNGSYSKEAPRMQRCTFTE